MQTNDKIMQTKLNIYRQAGLAALAMVVTLVIAFAMTVAWYSNVIHTGDMTFQASEWDFQFEGEVNLGPGEGAVVLAAPGDSGMVSLSVSNDTGDTLGVIVNVMKGALSAEMQKRIFFYADAPVVENGETVTRSYISAQDNYIYKLLTGNTLKLGDNFNSDVPLKWEWVYDVLGYYVRGTIATTEEGTAITNIEDYIRPVVYDYEHAKYDAYGDLTEINGYTAYDYITQLYLTDGFVGTEVQTPLHGYYPVEIDESGYGVWLYLCNETEILAANQWDSELAGQEEKQNFSVRVVLAGQKINEEITPVNSLEELVTQLTAGAERVQLPADLSLSGDMSITIPEGVETILDLNGNSLKSGLNGNVINLSESSRLTILNGTLELNGMDGEVPAITVSDAVLSMTDVVVTGAGTGIKIDDTIGDGTDSKVYLHGCTMDTNDTTILIYGNGTVDTGKTVVVVDECVLNSRSYVGISGNGSADKSGTDIQIFSSKVSGYYAGVYQPQQNSSMTITNSTISGYTGLAVKGGTVAIENSQIYGNGESAEPAYGVSGWTDTGDGIYVEDNYGGNITITVKGEHTAVKSTNRYAVECFAADSDHVTIILYGGTFVSNGALDGDVSTYLPNGGGYVCTLAADGSFRVDLAPAELSE